MVSASTKYDPKIYAHPTAVMLSPIFIFYYYYFDNRHCGEQYTNFVSYKSRKKCPSPPNTSSFRGHCRRWSVGILHRQISFVGGGEETAAAIILASTSSSSTAADDVATAADDGEAAGLPTNFFNYRGIDIDILERLPTPYGLVRYGVAPDHPEVKNVEKEFASLFVEHCSSVGGETTTIPSSSSIIANKLIAHNSISTLSYFGNVDVGHTISLSQLQSLYDIVVLAYGCQSSDKRLGIPGEAELEGVLSAREFVAWYNGHPEFGHIGHIVHRCLWPKSLSDEGAKDGNNSSSCSCSSSSGTEVSKARVVVIGQGNVALDVARILSKGTAGLIDTDTPTSVLKILKGGVSHVSIVGRRGHVQGAFTIKVSGNDSLLVIAQFKR